MAQHDYVVANDSGAAVRADINNALGAIVSNNSGASAPSTTYAYQWWADTTTGLLKMRDSTNSSWITIGTMASIGFGLGVSLQWYGAGCGLANGTDAVNDIDIAAGEWMSDDSAYGNRVLMRQATAPLVKRLDAAWTVGTNQGGLDTGAVGNNTYHVYLIQRPDTGVVDALFSLSASAPTMPTNYTKKRRIGSIVRSGGTILGFTQSGDRFLLDVPVNFTSGAAPGTSAWTVTLTVPVGIQVDAILGLLCGGHATAGTCLRVSDLEAPDTAPTSANSQVIQSAAAQYNITMDVVRTNTSAQVRARVSASDANTLFYCNSHGWIDTRNR